MHNIRLFGFLVDRFGTSTLTIPFQPDTDALMKCLLETYPELHNITFQLAVNNKTHHQNVQLTPTSTLALLPPFAGG